MKKILIVTLLLLHASLAAKDAYIVGDAAKAAAAFPSWTVQAATKAEVVMPVPTVTSSPQIPFELRRAGISGSIKAALLIDAKGKVAETAIWSSDNEKLNAPVLAALKTWKFKPAVVKGKKEAYIAVAPFDFNFTVEAPVRSAEELQQRLSEAKKTK